MIESPERIGVEAIHRARSPDLRRIMLERYRSDEPLHGIAAYLRDTGARALDKGSGTSGTLGQLDIAEMGPMLMVEVANHSPEPDGTYPHFLLRVHPELRQLYWHHSFGEWQELTARTRSR